MLTTGLDLIPGMTGSNGNTATAGNDLIIGIASAGTTATLQGTDQIDAGEGTDTLKVISDVGGAIAVNTVSNVEVIEVRSSAADTIDTTTVAGLTHLNVTSATGGSFGATAAVTTEVSVSGASGTIDIDGGNNVTVSDATADQAITIGAIAAAAGTITVTDTKQGNGAIAIDGGTDVTVVATADNTGTITIGAGTAATGAVKVTQNLTNDGVAALAGGAIDVTGGTSVDITVNATSKAKNDDSDNAIAIGAVTVTGDGKTTAVTVNQNASVTIASTAAGVTTNDQTVVTFAALASGQDTIVGGLKFTASKALTAEQVAAAFAGLTAADTQTATGPTANGFFTGSLAAGYTSGAASGKTVTFSAAQGTGDMLTVNAGTIDPTKAFTGGTAGAPADASTNAVTYGAVKIDDNATAAIKTITVNGYANGSTIGSGAATTALETLNLSNAAGTASMTVADTADTLALTLSGMGTNVDGTEAVLTFTAAPLTLNVTSTGNNYVDLTAAATTALNVSGTGVLDIADAALAALKTVTVTGTAGLTLNGGESATLTSVDTTGTTGAVTASIKGDTATYAGGAGVDAVTVANAGTAISKALDLGAGNDVLTLVGATVEVPTVTLNGGDGTDTLSIDTASAAALDGDTLFAAKLSSFERLFINNSAASTAVDVANLGFANYVTVAGSAGTLTLDNLANNGTVNVVGNASTGVTVNVKDAATGVADVLNVGLSAAAGDLTVAEVETIALSVTAAASANLIADKATTVTLSGWGNLTLDLDAGGSLAGNTVTLVDGSAGYFGALTMDAELDNLVVKGGSGADNLLADANDVALYGGDGNDTLTVDGGLRVNLHGGAGKDTFVIDAAASNALDSYTVINGVDSGDVIQFGDAVKFISTKIALSVGADETLLNYANQAAKQLGENEMGWFQRGGNTFIVLDQTAGAANAGGAADSFDNGVDQIIMITGLVDLGTGASYNYTLAPATNILEIV